MSRRIISAAAAIALVALIVPSTAKAQTGFGVRAGWIPVDGDHISMDAKTAFGAHVSLGLIPLLKFQIGAEYLSGDADYDYGPGLVVTGQDFKSIGIFADVRYPIKVFPMIPVKPVIGVGLNMNLMTYMDEDAITDFIATGSSDPADFTQNGYHFMLGLTFKPPILPFAIMAEHRWQTINLDDGKIHNNGFVVGLTFGF